MLVSLKGDINMEEKIVLVLNEMSEYLTVEQMKKLQEVIVKTFAENEAPKTEISNDEFLKMFLDAKRIEGCSDRTIKYYRVTIEHLLKNVISPIRKITTEMMRAYLVDYQKINNCGKTTVDNIRRNISSFFSWLEEEDYILKSPMRRIHKIKTQKTVKNIISDEEIEKLRDNCKNIRDTAMIDLLYSTGIRVGELVKLNIEDIDFSERECVVFGKGDKERRVYFDAKSKIHLKNYIESRKDNNPALFVTLNAPYDRLKISGVEIRIRELGRMLNLEKVHPHKFRRTMATRAIDKGMPIEQVQKILGHSQIDTTMQYAIVNQNNVKASHRKYIAWTNIKYIPAELHEKLYATIKPQRNDILMSKNGVNYGVAAVNDTDEVFDIYVSLALLRPKKIIDPVFLKCVINNPETKWQFDSSIKGIGVPNLHLGEIKKTRMFLPPIELQNQFADFVRAIDKSKVSLYYKNRKGGFSAIIVYI